MVRRIGIHLGLNILCLIAMCVLYKINPLIRETIKSCKCKQINTLCNFIRINEISIQIKSSSVELRASLANLNS